MMRAFSLWKGEMLVPSPVTTMADILADVAQRHELTVAELKSPEKTRKVAYARQEAMWIMAKVERKDGVARYSLPMIGAFLNRDHTTVIHGIRAYAARNDLQRPSRLGVKREWSAAA